MFKKTIEKLTALWSLTVCKLGALNLIRAIIHRFFSIDPNLVVAQCI